MGWVDAHCRRLDRNSFALGRPSYDRRVASQEYRNGAKWLLAR
jgi:hypothetical protein